MYSASKTQKYLSISEINNKLLNNKYPYIGAIIQFKDIIYPLIIIKGNESNFINFVQQNNLQVIDFTFGFDCGSIINEIFILNINFYNEHLTINQLAEILFSLSEEELAMLNLIPINPDKFNINQESINNNYDYQNVSWSELKQIVNNINDDVLNQLGYKRERININGSNKN